MELVITVLSSLALAVPYVAFGGYLYSVLTARLARNHSKRMFATALVSATVSLYLLFPVVAVIWLHQLVVLFVQT